MSIVATSNASKVAREIAEMNNLIFGQTKMAFEEVAQRYRAYHRKERMQVKGATVGIRSGRTLQTGEGGAKLVNTGVAGHFKYQSTGTTLNDLRTTLGTRSRVAIEHEKGGAIYPHGRKYMTVPMPAAQNRFGGNSKAAKRLLAQSKAQMGYQSATSGGFGFNAKLGRARSPLFVIRVGGRSFLAQRVRSGERQKYQPGAYGQVRRKTSRESFRTKLKFWFHLQRSTRLRPRLEFLSLWDGWGEKNFFKIFNRVATHGRRAKGVA